MSCYEKKTKPHATTALANKTHIGTTIIQQHDYGTDAQTETKETMSNAKATHGDPLPQY